MTSNLKADPVDDGGEAHESKLMSGKLFVARNNAQQPFNPRKRVFDGVAVPIPLSAEVEGDTATYPRGDEDLSCTSG